LEVNTGEMADLKRIIAKLEKQQRELGTILVALREIDGTGPIEIKNRGSLDSFEKRVVEGALTKAGGNQVEAARILGVGRDRPRYKMSKHGIKGW
jgi:DNA-binding NtrC family response regulator